MESASALRALEESSEEQSEVADEVRWGKNDKRECNACDVVSGAGFFVTMDVLVAAGIPSRSAGRRQ